MNVYSELLELLSPQRESEPQVCFGTISGVSPLQITVGDRHLERGLLLPRGTKLREEDLGREVALLPCRGGFLMLFEIEEGDT